MTHDSCADVCVASGRTSSESCIDDCKFYIPFPTQVSEGAGHAVEPFLFKELISDK